MKKKAGEYENTCNNMGILVRAFITRILNNDARKNHVTGKWGNKYNGDKHRANTL